MVLVLGHNSMSIPYHRQNRRRERPGSRARRSLSRKNNIQELFNEGISEARDPSLSLPSDRAKPSPALRQNFEQSWQRWKARQAEEEQQKEKQKEAARAKLEAEQIKIFGGDIDDDALRRLGILWDSNVEHQDNLVASDVPANPAPSFVMRPGKLRRSRRMNWRSLPLNLSYDDLSNDLANTHSSPTIQHRSTTSQVQSHINVNNIQSLPLRLSPANLSALSTTTIATPEDWSFIDTTPNHTPTSEAETWILLGDDS